MDIRDAELLQRYRDRRDEQAFAWIVERHQRMMRAIAQSILRVPGSDVDDAVQVVLVHLAQRPEAIAEPERLGGWLAAATARTARNLRRSRDRRARHEADAATAAVVLPAPTPEDAQDVQGALADALAQLPAALREAVVLCHLEGRTQREAARIAGCAVGTMGWRASRGLRRLRAHLARDGIRTRAWMPVFLTWSCAPRPGTGVGMGSLGLRLGATAGVGAVGLLVVGSYWHTTTPTPPVRAAPHAQVADPLQAPLLALTELRYVGSFRVPGGTHGVGSNAVFDYADLGLAFDARRHGLFLKGHAYGQLVAEIAIPNPQPILHGDLRPLPVADILQPFADPTAGHLQDDHLPSRVSISGLLVWEGALLGTCSGWMDVTGQQRRGWFTSSLDLSRPGCTGLRRIGGPELPERMCTGFLGAIPPPWRQPLHGDVLAGHATGNVVGGMPPPGPVIVAVSFGRPTAGGDVPAQPLVYYPAGHPLDPSTDPTRAHPATNGSTLCSGIAFLPGTRTVAVIGSTGLGIEHVGLGTTDRAQDGHPGPDGVMRVYDPATAAGIMPHAWPYAAYVWLYDAAALAASAGGRRQPWEVKPYAMGTLELPVDAGTNQLNGVAIDPERGLLYIAQANADHLEPYASRPLIHVFACRGGQVRP